MKLSLRFALVILLSVLSFAQLNRGTLTGVVADSSGAVVPGARITIRNVATNAVYRTGATGVGQYTMPNLPIGTYEVTFEADGFKSLVRKGIELGVTDVLRVDATLEVGTIIESVVVTAQVTRVQTDAPEVSTSLSNRQLTDLPLSVSGIRDPENFAFKLVPGVSGSSWANQTNGSTSFSNEVLLDGASVTTHLSGHFGESSVSPESVAEFKVQTTGVSAEFGRTQGGVFNFVMKGGSNEIHGSGYGELRNEAFNANTFSNKFAGRPRALERKQDYAGSFGGPVYLPRIYDGRNRTFFYTTYERFRQRARGISAPNRTVPLAEFYQGDFSRLLGASTGYKDALGRDVAKGAIYDPATFRQLANGRWVGDMFQGNKIPVSSFSKVAQRLNALASASYLPTVRDASGAIPLVNNSTFTTDSVYDQYQFSEKVDQMLNDRQKLSAVYSYTLLPSLKLDQGGMWNENLPDGGPLSKARFQTLKSQLARINYDYAITPHLLDHFTLFYNRMGNRNCNKHAADGIDGAKELGIANLSTQGYPVINWGGGPFITLDTPGDPACNYQANTGWGFLDTLSFSHGRHFLKAGFDMRGNHFTDRNNLRAALNFNARATAIPSEAFSGNLTGYSFASYLLGIVDSATVTDPYSFGDRRRYYGLFFQDDFKVTSRLTLNLGLRWEYQPPFTEATNRMAGWNPAKTDPLSGLPGAYEFTGSCKVCTGRNHFGSGDLHDFAPRIGFAWHPLTNWTLRGAYGIYYEASSDGGGIIFKTFPWVGTWPLGADAVQPWAGIFNWDNGFPVDRHLAASFNPSWGNANSAWMVSPQFAKTPYSQQWNFNIQRQLGKDLVLDIGYVANKGTRLWNGVLQRINQLPPSVLKQYGRNLNNAVKSAADAAANGIAYPYPGFVGTVASALRPYPQLQGNTTVNVYAAPVGFSTFNSLQVTVDKRLSRGLTAYGNYVWSKVLSNTSSSYLSDLTGPLDYYNLKLEKSPAPFHMPHVVKAYIDWELPVGKSKLLLGSASTVTNALLGGWSLSAILNYNSGSPLNFPGSAALSGGWNGALNRANIAAGNMKASAFDKSKFEFSTASSPNNTYLNKSLFSDPAPLTLGTSAPSYSQVLGFGTINEDVGLRKSHRIHEKYRVQVRAEFLNIFNRHNLSSINTTVTSPLFGQVTSVTGNRTAQVGMRLDF